MALKSKLTNNYPVASGHLSGDYKDLDPIFSGRLSALAKASGVAFNVTSGYRSIEEQTKLYNMYLSYKKTGIGTIKSAAVPGKSSHNYKIAADISTQPIRGMDNSQLKKYGLCKPIKSEGWHVQAIETQYERDFAKWGFVEADMTKQEVVEIMNELDPIYRTLNDIPDWGRETIRTFIADGKIKPDNGVINLRLSMLRIIVILSR